MSNINKVLSITIGRNVKGVPMGQAHWDSFKRDVNEVLDQFEQVGMPVLCRESHEGEGSWLNNAGEREFETSYKVTVIYENGPRIFEIEFLAPAVRELAITYNQEAIAITVGESTLIEGIQ